MSASTTRLPSRYERKFFVSALTREEVEALVRLHPAMFSEEYPQRPVNSLYVDSATLEHYLQHVNGAPERLKVRIRWYGTLFGLVEHPVLELKRKRGWLISKDSYPLNAFVLGQGFSQRTLATVWRGSTLPDSLRLEVTSLEPVALIRYRRRYFRSSDRRYRLTLDWEFQYYRVTPGENTFVEQMTDALSSVVEIKYAEEDERSVEHITAHFPLRVTKSSKYLSAIEQLAVW